MIDLNKRRTLPDDMVQVRLGELPDIDLQTVALGDWIEGIGSLSTHYEVGFFHHLGRNGFRIAKIPTCGLCGCHEEMVHGVEPDVMGNGTIYVHTVSCTNAECRNHYRPPKIDRGSI